MLRATEKRRASSKLLWHKLLEGPRIRNEGGWFKRDPLRLPFVVGGTNVLWDDEQQVMELAFRIGEVCSSLGAPLVFKASWDKANRTSGESFRGVPLDKGLRMLERIKEELKLPILTDVHETAHVGAVAQVADIVQIPSFLCRQTDLIVAAAESGRIVNLKRGQFASAEVMGRAVAKARELGNNELVMVSERGMAFGVNDLVFDPRQLPRLRDACGSSVPILVDVTHSCQTPPSPVGHSGGDRAMVPLVARAAAAAGVDGIFVECHPDPENAPVDKAVQIRVEDLGPMLEDVLNISRAVYSSTRRYEPPQEAQ